MPEESLNHSDIYPIKDFIVNNTTPSRTIVSFDALKITNYLNFTDSNVQMIFIGIYDKIFFAHKKIKNKTWNGFRESKITWDELAKIYKCNFFIKNKNGNRQKNI
jgi:hypothetical protein